VTPYLRAGAPSSGLETRNRLHALMLPRIPAKPGASLGQQRSFNALHHT
jgi:hypothetical protein